MKVILVVAMLIVAGCSAKQTDEHRNALTLEQAINTPDPDARDVLAQSDSQRVLDIARQGKPGTRIQKLATLVTRPDNVLMMVDMEKAGEFKRQ